LKQVSGSTLLANASRAAPSLSSYHVGRTWLWVRSYYIWNGAVLSYLSRSFHI